MTEICWVSTLMRFGVADSLAAAATEVFLAARGVVVLEEVETVRQECGFKVDLLSLRGDSGVTEHHLVEGDGGGTEIRKQRTSKSGSSTNSRAVGIDPAVPRQQKCAKAL